MAAGKTVPVSFDDWVDLNTAASVTVGAEMSIHNRGDTNPLRLKESAAKPTGDAEADATDSETINPRGGIDSTFRATAGSLTIWSKALKSGGNSLLFVQGV